MELDPRSIRTESKSGVTFVGRNTQRPEDLPAFSKTDEALDIDRLMLDGPQHIRMPSSMSIGSYDRHVRRLGHTTSALYGVDFARVDIAAATNSPESESIAEYYLKHFKITAPFASFVLIEQRTSLCEEREELKGKILKTVRELELPTMVIEAAFSAEELECVTTGALSPLAGAHQSVSGASL